MLTTKKRLQQISHYFLSEETPEKSMREDTYALAIMLRAQQEHSFPLDALAHALLARGKSCVILHTDSDPYAVAHCTDETSERPARTRAGFDDSRFRNLLEEIGILQPPDIYLIPTSTPYSPYLELCCRIVLPVASSVEGIRRGYIQAKQIIEQKRTQPIGIIMTDSNNIGDAEQGFEKLAIAAQRFLNCQLINYGYLLTAAGNANYPVEVEPDSITDIAERIAGDQQEWRECGVFPQYRSSTQTSAAAGW